MFRITPTTLLTAIVTAAVPGCNDSASHKPLPPPSQPAPTAATTIDFEKHEIGKTPGDFTAALTGGGGAVSWIIQEDATAPSSTKVLTQTSADSTDYRFPVCVYTGLSAKDVDATVRFKAVSGKTDRAAGLVVRYKDKDNYYVVRANALEDNVNLYKVERGSRYQFAGGEAKVTSGAWHTLKLSVVGTHFWVSMDGKLLFDADDQTFTDAGKVGLWTKADSVTEFDDFSIAVLDAK